MFNILLIIKNKKEFDCLYIISEYNQAIINIKQNKNDNPYHEAIDFLKNIDDNLNEDSCFFDLLLQYNSGIYNDIITLNESEENISSDTKNE